MNVFRKYLIFVFVTSISLYSVWTYTNPDLSVVEQKKASLAQPSLIIHSNGYDRGRGNIVGVQAFITGYEYLQEKYFFASMESYIEEAIARKFLQEDTLLVYPEHIGTPLFLLEEKKSILKHTSLEDATRYAFWSNPLRFVGEIFSLSRPKEIPIIKYWFTAKAEKMRDVYFHTFSTLASMYKTPILAGSILLPKPSLRDGKLVLGAGELENVSVLFGKDGNAKSLFFKNKLALPERRIAISKKEDQIVETNSSLGQFAVFLSHDSLYTTHYQKITRETNILLSPACLWSFQSISWQNEGFISDKQTNTTANIPDIVQNSKQLKNWMQFSLADKIRITKAKYGLQVFLQGKLFGLRFQGYSY
ncbi:MAG: hypothetical protein AAF518_21020, partial [Spirochaetota bacterium]